MIDDATLAEWELTPSPNGYLQQAVKEIRRLRKEVEQYKGYHQLVLRKYEELIDEGVRDEADLAAHRAVVRELAQLLENACAMRQSGGFLGDNIDRWLTSIILLLAHPLVQQAREET